MAALLVCTLAALISFSAVAANGPRKEAWKKNMADCAELHNVDNAKDAIHNLDAKYGCFYECLLGKAQESMGTDSPFSAMSAECEEAHPSTDDKCNDAFVIKSCMQQKMKKMHGKPKEQDENETEQ